MHDGERVIRVVVIRDCIMGLWVIRVYCMLYAEQEVVRDREL